jgi:hypothetical protein
VKERDFLNWIIACAEATGWKVWHVPAPMVHDRKRGFVGSPRAAGLPDLFLLHDDPPRMIVAEVKGTGGKLSDRQQEFLRLARDVAEQTIDAITTEPTVAVYVWMPEHQEIIEDILRSKVLA